MMKLQNIDLLKWEKRQENHFKQKGYKSTKTTIKTGERNKNATNIKSRLVEKYHQDSHHIRIFTLLLLLLTMMMDKKCNTCTNSLGFAATLYKLVSLLFSCSGILVSFCEWWIVDVCFCIRSDCLPSQGLHSVCILNNNIIILRPLAWIFPSQSLGLSLMLF